MAKASLGEVICRPGLILLFEASREEQADVGAKKVLRPQGGTWNESSPKSDMGMRGGDSHMGDDGVWVA
jgi:hypothetical protein